jgi:RNA polymerase sigma-70 factor (ECF subfamily)
LRELTERELVEGCQREDRRSQETLYGRFARRMYAVCLRYARHQMEAQDLMQEGLLEGWIRRIMVHTCINHYRKKAFQNERIGMEHMPEGTVSATAVEHLGQEELMKLIGELPDGYRMVFNLYAIEGYDHAEIAEMIGCGESTSRSQLAKARRMLQERIAQQDVTHAHERGTSDR